PVEPRAQAASLVTRQFCPSVVIRIAARLIVRTACKRVSERAPGFAREESDRIGAAEGSLVEQELRFVARPVRDQVHDAGERRADALDQLHSLEIERWRLQQAEGIGLRAGERQTVR